MVATDQSDALGIANLERNEQQECLDRVRAAINEVTHEQVVGVGALAADLEQFLQVIELAMDVTTDL